MHDERSKNNVGPFTWRAQLINEWDPSRYQYIYTEEESFLEKEDSFESSEVSVVFLSDWTSHYIFSLIFWDIYLHSHSFIILSLHLLTHSRCHSSTHPFGKDVDPRRSHMTGRWAVMADDDEGEEGDSVLVCDEDDNDDGEEEEQQECYSESYSLNERSALSGCSSSSSSSGPTLGVESLTRSEVRG